MYWHFFHEKKRVNRRLFDDIRYLDVKTMYDELHFLRHLDSGKVVGDLALRQSPYDDEVLWLMHVSVTEKFQNRGIASRLLALCAQHVVDQKKTLSVSSFTETGEAYLRPVIERLQNEIPELKIIMKDEPDYGW